MSMVRKAIFLPMVKATTILTLMVGTTLVAPAKSAHAQVFYDRSNTSFALTGDAMGFFANWWDSVTGALSIRLTAANVSGQAGVMRLFLNDQSHPSTGFVRGSDVPATREWDVDFGYWAGSGGGADGLAFVVRTAPEGLNPRSVASGGGLGYTGATGFAIEFDTYDNGGGENGVQAMLSTVGWPNTPISPNIRPAFSLRGNHRVRITCRFRNFRPYWDNRDRIVSVYVDSGTPLLTVWMPSAQLRSATTLAGTFGFTAGTGGLADEHLIYPDWRVTVY